jgi:ABC-type bacteriocin/lantibiotic exporter with double-glycine peptidase domain
MQWVHHGIWSFESTITSCSLLKMREALLIRSQQPIRSIFTTTTLFERIVSKRHIKDVSRYFIPNNRTQWIFEQRTYTSQKLAEQPKPSLSNLTDSHEMISFPDSISTKATLKKLLRLARPEIGYIGGAIGLLLISSGVNMLIPYGVGRIMDFIMAGTVIQQMQHYVWWISGVILLSGISNFGRVFLIKLAGERVVTRLRSQLFDHLIQQEIAFFDRTRTGELISRLSADTTVVGKGLSEYISHGTRHLITSLAGVGIMIYMSPKLTLVILCVIPPVFLCAVYYGRFVKTLAKKSQDSLSEATKAAEEIISNIRTVYAFAQKTRETQRYS